jgi:hypothetical protein
MMIYYILYWFQEKYATIAVSEMRGRMLMGKKLQIDFASRECEVAFFDHLTKQGFHMPTERPWERVSSKLVSLCTSSDLIPT